MSRIDEGALLKAKGRLRLVEQSLSRLQEAADFEEFTGVWYTLLCAAKNVYNQLEQGSKVSPDARKWFDGKAEERRNDPLLQYMYQARNDDEHGIRDVVRNKQISAGMAVPAGQDFSASFLIRVGEDSELVVSDFKSTVPGAFVVEEREPMLVPVYDRKKREYLPPSTHRGEPLPDNSPHTVARLNFKYLSALVAEAEAFA